MSTLATTRRRSSLSTAADSLRCVLHGVYGFIVAADLDAEEISVTTTRAARSEDIRKLRTLAKQGWENWRIVIT